ncbi:hypothetical protein TrispH2_009457 [Trichoplax sp. H2]|nr:hypothetical protein TrispH2_009457 [Trichoplax sp. H2]|eukprot:RDD38854.1 hypothetical protein TrispH2_009457 [Trichoplax sp. H2]
MSSIKPVLNVPVSNTNVIVTPSLISFRKLGIQCDITIALALIQIIVAIIGLSIYCPFGIYILSFNQYFNTFWVAGPMLVLGAVGHFINRKSNHSERDILIQKILSIVCLLCLFGGYVILGITMRILINAETSIKVICEFDQEIKSETLQPVAMAVVIVQICLYLYYLVISSLTKRAFTYRLSVLMATSSQTLTVPSSSNPRQSRSETPQKTLPVH